MFSDVVVLVPGILGSELSKDGRLIWGATPGAIWGALAENSFAQLEGGATAPAPSKQSNGRDADPFFLDEEKILWDWPDVTGRAIEEFR